MAGLAKSEAGVRAIAADPWHSAVHPPLNKTGLALYNPDFVLNPARVPPDAAHIPLNVADFALNRTHVPSDSADLPLNATDLPLNMAGFAPNVAYFALNAGHVQMDAAQPPLNSWQTTHNHQIPNMNCIRMTLMLDW